MLHGTHVAHLADRTAVDPFLDFQETRHGAAVEGHVQAHALLRADVDNFPALLEAHGHRLLDIDVLAGLGDQQ